MYPSAPHLVFLYLPFLLGYNSDVTDYLPPWRNHEGMKDFNNDVAQHFSGSQATPGQKAQPFSSFSSATPQENVSPGLAQQKIARGGGGVPNSNNNTSRTLLHNIQWPLRADPPGVSPEFPLLATRIAVTILCTISTWYLHLFNGYSPSKLLIHTNLVDIIVRGLRLDSFFFRFLTGYCFFLPISTCIKRHNITGINVFGSKTWPSGILWIICGNEWWPFGT